MGRRRGVILIVGLCTSSLFGGVHVRIEDPGRVRVQIGNDTKSTGPKSEVSIRFGSLRVTNAMVEMRCEIVNGCEQDIWIYDDSPYDVNGARGTNAALYTDKEGQTILIFRGINLPLHGFSTGSVAGTYARLRAGESRPYVFLVVLPVVVQEHDLQGFEEAMQRGTEYFSRLAFQAGYYTSEDLASFEEREDQSKGDRRIPLQSKDRIQLYGPHGTGISQSERAATMETEGVHIPYKQWIAIKKEWDPKNQAELASIQRANRIYNRSMQLSMKLWHVIAENVLASSDKLTSPLPPGEYQYANTLLRYDPNLYDETTQRVADVFLQLVDGKLPPSELTQRLDAIASRPEREQLLDELRRKELLADAPKPVPLTPIESLRDLFYSYAIDLEQYQYAQRLFRIDNRLYNDPAKRIADVYVQVARGRLSPGDLTSNLERILSRADREKFLEQLQAKQ